MEWSPKRTERCVCPFCLPWTQQPQIPTEGRGRVDVLNSTAAALYHASDVDGARQAVESLLAVGCTNRRSLLTAVSVGALLKDTGIVQRAARLLQASA